MAATMDRRGGLLKNTGFLLVLVVVVLISLGSLVVDGRPVVRKYLEREEMVSLPEGWSDVSDANPEAEMKLVVAIKQQNLAELEDLFWRVSNPNHEDYGRHLTVEQVGELVAPSDETVQMVEDWLLEHGIENYEIVQNKDFIIAHTTASKVDFLLLLLLSFPFSSCMHRILLIFCLLHYVSFT